MFKIVFYTLAVKDQGKSSQNIVARYLILSDEWQGFSKKSSIMTTRTILNPAIVSSTMQGIDL